MAEGLITLASAHSATETASRLDRALAAKGATIFARIDHAANANTAGMALAPTLLLIFGNAKGGTPLMQMNQAIGIDLPLKALVWHNASGKTWLSYNDPAWLARRHGLDAGSPPVTAMATLLAALAETATA